MLMVGNSFDVCCEYFTDFDTIGKTTHINQVVIVAIMKGPEIVLTTKILTIYFQHYQDYIKIFSLLYSTKD